jgi:hypothetical protein
MWPFSSSKSAAAGRDADEDEESVYTEEEYEEDVEYEVEVTDDEADSDDDAVLVEAPGVSKREATEETTEGEQADQEDLVDSVGESAVASHDEDNGEQDGDDTDYQNEDGDDDDDDDDDEDHRDGSQAETEDEDDGADEEEEEEEEEALTSMEEKHSLLKLAAEHDRVDILQSILSSSEESSTPEERLSLLNHKQQPPLHIAVSFGSTNATTCLLRLGANPALRPEPSDMKKIVGRTAWELAFGTAEQGASSGTGWFTPKKGIQPVDMAPSKREGIRHAFTAEALRSIGADDVVRLQQLLKSGMPVDTDIGGDKDIAGWCREMGAAQCLKLVEPNDKDDHEEKKADEDAPNAHNTEMDSSVIVTPVKPKNTKEIMPGSPSTPSLHVRRLSAGLNDAESLRNRLEELETLAMSLSTYLDNLAEEVSVCHGLLLMGNGASALASHVRALRETQDFLRQDLEDRTSVWADADAELDLYMRRYMIEDDGTLLPESLLLRSSSLKRQLSTNDPIQLRAQVGASENKIRKLRASIADMSEESEEAMKEVEKRGLTGGIQLVRKLRLQIRELEYQISEAKSGEALCKAKLQNLQYREQQQQKQGIKRQTQQMEAQQDAPRDVNHLPSVTEDMANDSPAPKAPSSSLTEDSPAMPTDLLSSESMKQETRNMKSRGDLVDVSQSERIAAGKSDALMKYNPKAQGYMPLDLWQIILRIIGLGRVAVKQQVEELKKQSSNVMIV